MRERVPESSRKFWLLLNADRWLVTIGIVSVVFVVLVFIGTIHSISFPQLFAESDPIETLFQGLLTSIITGVTLVLTLSQLVLSQEQGPVGDQRERMEGAMSFRKDVEDIIKEPVSPAQPSAFLRSLVKYTKRRAEAVAETVNEIDDVQLNEQVEEYVDSVRENAESVRTNLEGSQFGEFDVVFSALNYNYSWKLYAARRIQAEHEDVLTDAANEALDELIKGLELFGPAREHFKTLYFQWELINLSRIMLYASIPALITSIAGIIYLEPTMFPGTIVGVPILVIIVSAAIAVSLLPFAFLLSYILRIATVTKRTLSIGPFILRETDRSRDFDWDQTTPEEDAGD